MKTIKFEISYIKNQEIHQNGYVEVSDDENEMPEWFYYDQQGFTVPKEFTHHDGIGLTQIGATDEQLAELEDFIKQVNIDFIDYVNEVILTAEEDEDETYTKGDLIIQINDGDIPNRCIIQSKLWEKVDYVEDIYEQFIDSEELDDIEFEDLQKLADNKITVKEFADKYGYEWDV